MFVLTVVLFWLAFAVGSTADPGFGFEFGFDSAHAVAFAVAYGVGFAIGFGLHGCRMFVAAVSADLYVCKSATRVDWVACCGWVATSRLSGLGRDWCLSGHRRDRRGHRRNRFRPWPLRLKVAHVLSCCSFVLVIAAVCVMADINQHVFRDYPVYGEDYAQDEGNLCWNLHSEVVILCQVCYTPIKYEHTVAAPVPVDKDGRTNTRIRCSQPVVVCHGARYAMQHINCTETKWFEDECSDTDAEDEHKEPRIYPRPCRWTTGGRGYGRAASSSAAPRK